MSQNNRKMEISSWILAHTQLSEALELAWEDYNKNKSSMEDEDGKNERIEREKIISQIVHDVWIQKLDENQKKNNNNNQQNQNRKTITIEGDCTNYNIHQLKNPNLGLKDVTQWRLQLRNCKIESHPFNNAKYIECKALEYNVKDSRKKKSKKWSNFI